MRRITIPVLLFLSLQHSTKAQQTAIDSLEKQLTTILPDTVRAMSMMRIAVNYEGIDTLESAKAYKAAIAFAVGKKLNYEAGVIYQNQNFLLINKGLYAEAKTSLDSALYYLELTAHPKATVAKALVLGSLGSVARDQGDYKAAIDYQLKGIDILEKAGRQDRLITACLNVSALYKELGEFQKQEEYAKKALFIAKNPGLSNKLFMPYSYIVYSLAMQNEYQKAKLYLDTSKLYYNSNEPYQALVSYHLIAGLVYMNLNMLDSAEAAFKQGYPIAEKYKAVFSMTQCKMQLGRVFTLQKEFSEAEPILLSAMEDVKKTNEPIQLQNVLDYLSRFYDESGNYKKAVQYYKEYKEVSDSIASKQNKQYAAELEIKYATEKKDNEIKLQKAEIQRKEILNYIIAGGAATLLLISLLGYRNYRHQQKLQQQRISELEKEKQLTAIEAVLKGEEQERTRLAKDLHDGLGGMLSGIKYSFQTMKGNLIMTPDNVQAFERSMDMLDSSIKEMRRVAHNMMPEALVKFGLDTALQDFCNDVNQSGALKVNYQSIGLKEQVIDQTTGITIYRIVQELLHNSIKHAAATSAIVQVSKVDGLLSVTVEDDGRGFDTAILKQSKGIGWTNIQNRVEFLKGKLDVNSQEGKGVSVLIEFPV
jgi:two-component system, NarL family, sensor kinase